MMHSLDGYDPVGFLDDDKNKSSFMNTTYIGNTQNNVEQTFLNINDSVEIPELEQNEIKNNLLNINQESTILNSNNQNITSGNKNQLIYLEEITESP